MLLQIFKLEMPRGLSMHWGPDETVNWSNLFLPWLAASATPTLALLEGTAVAAVLSTSILPVWLNAVLWHSAPFNITPTFTSALLQLHDFDAIWVSWHDSVAFCPLAVLSWNHLMYTWLCTSFQKFVSYCPFNKINAFNIIFHKIFCSPAFHWLC